MDVWESMCVSELSTVTTPYMHTTPPEQTHVTEATDGEVVKDNQQAIFRIFMTEVNADKCAPGNTSGMENSYTIK